MNTLTLWTPCAEVRAETSDAEVLLTFAGELDQSLAEHFASLRALVVEGGRPVAVDLSEVTFFGAWAADALVALRAAAPADGFTVRAMSETVRPTLDACDLTLGARTDALDV